MRGLLRHARYKLRIGGWVPTIAPVLDRKYADVDIFAGGPNAPARPARRTRFAKTIPSTHNFKTTPAARHSASEAAA